MDKKYQKLTKTELIRLLNSGADLRGANLRGADLWGANLRDADLWGANLRDANLRDANLWGANLRDANLWGANLRGADLRGANLRGADLWGANLRDANLRDANLWVFNTTQNIAIYIPWQKLLKIGCEEHSLDHWLAHFEEIGKKNGYSEKEIDQYHQFMEMCKNE